MSELQLSSITYLDKKQQLFTDLTDDEVSGFVTDTDMNQIKDAINFNNSSISTKFNEIDNELLSDEEKLQLTDKISELSRQYGL